MLVVSCCWAVLTHVELLTDIQQQWGRGTKMVVKWKGVCGCVFRW